MFEGQAEIMAMDGRYMGLVVYIEPCCIHRHDLPPSHCNVLSQPQKRPVLCQMGGSRIWDGSGIHRFVSTAFLDVVLAGLRSES